MNYFYLSFCLFGSYLLGSVPWGYLLTRWFRKVDVRAYGSGNIGFTNVLRVAGKPAAGLTLILDGAKGWAAVGVVAPALGAGSAHPGIFTIAAFAAVVTGHIFPVFLRFRGGKGIATGAGALLALSPPVFLICLGIWAGLVAIFRYVSLGSVGAAAAIPGLVYLFGKPASLVIFSGLLGALIIIRHRDNIKRLLRGTERKIGEKVQVGDSPARPRDDK